MLHIFLIVLISATPILEQRAGIPYGIFIAEYHPLAVAVISYLGSYLPVPFILFLFHFIMDKILSIPFFSPLREFVDKKVRKGTQKVLKYKKWGLIIFVALPLPTTGLWTGSAVAAFLGIDRKKAMAYVAAGGLISAVIITLVCLLFPALMHVPSVVGG